jgi:hypothetical protein
LPFALLSSMNAWTSSASSTTGTDSGALASPVFSNRSSAASAPGSVVAPVARSFRSRRM